MKEMPVQLFKQQVRKRIGKGTYAEGRETAWLLDLETLTN